MKTLKLIIIVYGQFVPLKIWKEEKDKFSEQIKKCIEDKSWFVSKSLNEDDDCFVMGAAIMGWYFIEDKPSVSQEMLDVIKKSVNDGNEGDSWKSPEE